MRSWSEEVTIRKTNEVESLVRRSLWSELGRVEIMKGFVCRGMMMLEGEVVDRDMKMVKDGVCNELSPSLISPLRLILVSHYSLERSSE